MSEIGLIQAALVFAIGTKIAISMGENGYFVAAATGIFGGAILIEDYNNYKKKKEEAE